MIEVEVLNEVRLVEVGFVTVLDEVSEVVVVIAALALPSILDRF